MIAHWRFAAARVLPSGDIALLASIIDDVDQLTRKPEWIWTFGNEARIRKRTWGVIVQGVDTQIDPKKPLFATNLCSENASVFTYLPAPIHITYTGWLMGEKKITEQGLANAQLIVMFDDERVANFAIQRGLIIKGRQHECSIYDKSINLQQCFRCQMYKHIARHYRREVCCAYCAEAHNSGACPHPYDKEHARCANCIAENRLIKDPVQRLDIKHYAYARECPIRAASLAYVHQRRTHGPQFHPTVARQEANIPGCTTDPTPAEAAERSPRAEKRLAPTQRTASSRSKSASRKRAAAPPSPEPADGSNRPATRLAKRTQLDQEAPTPTPAEPSIIYETRARSRPIKPAQGQPILQSDIVPQAPLEAASVGSVPRVRRKQSARPVVDDDSEDELSMETGTSRAAEPVDTMMTRPLEDSEWAPSSQ